MREGLVETAQASRSSNSCATRILDRTYTGGQGMGEIRKGWQHGKKYVNIPSEKYIYVHKYVYICVFTYLCKMDEHRSYAGLS